MAKFTYYETKRQFNIFILNELQESRANRAYFRNYAKVTYGFGGNMVDRIIDEYIRDGLINEKEGFLYYARNQK